MDSSQDFSGLADLVVGDTCRVHWTIGVADSGRPIAKDSHNETFIWQTTNTFMYPSTYWTNKYAKCVITSTSISVYIANADGSRYSSSDYYAANVYKVDPAWVQVSKAYKKVNGSWVEQSDLTTVFDSNKSYIHSSTVAEV